MNDPVEKASPQSKGGPATVGTSSASQTWHKQSGDEVLHQLRSGPEGLTTEEATKRLAADGPNKLTEGRPISPFKILGDQFKSLVIWILIVAGIISGILGESVEAAAILAIVFLNALIGFYQEYHAENSIAALNSLTVPQAKVRRDGRIIAIAASRLVAGDVLCLGPGDLVGADARVYRSASLKCIESALTGESEAVSKESGTLDQSDVPLGDRNNMVFMGTTVAFGTAEGVVVATAMRTELGSIAGLITAADEDDDTPLEKRLEAFGKVLVWAALSIVALLIVLGLMRGTAPFELFMTAISLAVAAVPEGLPAVATIALALGVRRMAGRRALARKLAAVETLGSTNVICTDKTGTLTLGEMTVRSLFVDGNLYEVTGDGYGPEGQIRFEGRKAEGASLLPLRELATVLLGCNDAHLTNEGGAWKTLGDPTEGALLAAGAKAGIDRLQLEKDMPACQEIPFDSDRKRSTVIRQTPGGKFRAFINGAPDVLLERCTHLYTADGIVPLTEAGRRRMLEMNTTMAQHALRVLGSAMRDLDISTAGHLTADEVEHDLVFVGLSGMYDPPRSEAKEAVARCRAAGINVVMITGDHPQTAAAIAREIGLVCQDGSAVTGRDLDGMSDDDLRRRAPKFEVYARVTAAHKLRIVRALRAGGAVVAMTGDGVNDAPAIKGADIGIAMGRSGTEVTKQAADMIITDDHFATIVAAVEEGRGIYSNIRKTLQYLLAGSTAELLVMMICVIAGLPSPLLPIHLLWINLITDGLPALCLATDALDPDVMIQRPRERTERITSRGFLPTMVLTGLLTTAVTMAVYFQALKTGSVESARSSAFAVLVFAEVLRAFGARSERKPVWRISLLSNVNLVVVVAVSVALQVYSQHSPWLGRVLKTSAMSFSHCAILLAVAAIPLAVLEIVKVVTYGGRKPG